MGRTNTGAQKFFLWSAIAGTILALLTTSNTLLIIWALFAWVAYFILRFRR